MQQWVRNGWLREHRTSPAEIADLLLVAERDLHDCQAGGLSPDWRLNIAYNAALQLATAALCAAGFRAERESHHYRVLQSLALTVGADAALVNQLDMLRKKRNVGGYERAGAVSKQEAKEMQTLARHLRKLVADWLRTKHPQLL
ncbi:MAG: hypothetical protein ACRD2Q_06820 [Terriglobales bacterium]